MSVIRTYQTYFSIVSEFRRAPDWQQDMLLRGTLLLKCKTIEPADIRRRLRCFWTAEASKRNLQLQELQTWG
jgi:hypothetical protein